MRSKSHYYDAIVIGLGAMGSATLYQLTAQSSKTFKVLGIDQYSPPHVKGSSHGESRFTRLSGGDFEDYTLTAKRSHDLWSIIETKTETIFGKLHHPTGGLIIGSTEKNDFLKKTIASAMELNIEYRIFNAHELKNTYPQYKNISDEAIAYYEKEMGILLPENCIRAQLWLAKEQGAHIHMEEKLLRFEYMNLNRLHVFTDQNEYQTEKLILCVGPWIAQLLESKKAALFKIYPQVFYWFHLERSAIAQFQLGKFLPTLWLLENQEMFYTFPSQNELIRVAVENMQVTANCKPEKIVQEIHIERDFYQRYVSFYLNGVSNACERTEICLYTCTPHLRFLIDFLPGYDKKVMVVSPCSGRGFKHSAAIGEAISAYVLEVSPPLIDVIKLFGGWGVESEKN